MTSGGARTRSGPPPDPTALRRDRKNDAEWTTLPSEGRKGDPPAWPLEGVSAREVELWAVFWARPQAKQWEVLGQDFEVALYVRNLAQAEQPGAPVNLSTLVRQQGDALGLTIPGLRTNRWKIAGDQVAARRAEKAATDQPARSPSRDRFKVVGGTAAG